jgi:uncharacterized protein
MKHGLVNLQKSRHFDPMKSLRNRYANFLCGYTTWIMIVSLLLTASALLISWRMLKTEQSILALYDPESVQMQEYDRYLRQFGEPDDLIVVMEGGHVSERREAVSKLVRSLAAVDTQQIRRIFYKIPLNKFVSLLALQDEDLADLETALKDKRHPLRRLLAVENLEGLFQIIDQEISTGMENPSSATEDPSGFFEWLVQLFSYLAGELPSEIPGGAIDMTNWGALLEGKLDGVDGSGFLTADNGLLHLLFIKPSDISADAQEKIALVRLVRQHIEKLRPLFPRLSIAMTGDPVLTHDEFAISERDMLVASLFALVTTLLIFFLAFRSVVRPLLGFLCLLMGVSISFALAALSIGHLNLISLTFAVILIGLGTQYGIHIIARYEEERAQGTSIGDVVNIILTQTVPSLWMGALTTAAAFFSTLLIDFRGFRELGFIAGCGILVCFSLMSFVLPAFLVWYDRRHVFEAQVHRQLRWRSFLGRSYVNALTRFPSIVLVLALLVALLSVSTYFGSSQIHFDYNLLNLQAEGTEAVTLQKRLYETDVSPRFAIHMAGSREELSDLQNKVLTLPSVEKVESLLTILPQNDESKLKRVQDLSGNLLEHLSLGNRGTSVEGCLSSLKKLDQRMDTLEEKLFTGGFSKAIAATDRLRSSLDVLMTTLGDLPDDTAGRRLNLLQENLIVQIRDFLIGENKRSLMTADDLPDDLRQRFVSPGGTYALYVFPSSDLSSREGLTAFFDDLHSVSDRFTGPPLQMYEALRAMDTGWYQAALYAAIAIFLILLIGFKSWQWALLTMIPLAFGMAWICGMMALFDLPWNIVNLIALPLVLGIGADCGIHLVHRYREQGGRDLSFVLTSTGKAVSVAYADTLTSFLGLALATHQGLASLGQVTIGGIFCCYVAGMLVLPALVAMYNNRAQK